MAKVDPRSKGQHGLRYIALAAMGVAAFVAAMVMTATPGTDRKREFAWRAAVNRMEPGFLSAQRTFNRDVATLDGTALAYQIERNHLPALRALGNRMMQRKPSSDDKRKALTELHGPTIEAAALELAKVRGTIAPAQALSRQRDLALRIAAAQAKLVRLNEQPTDSWQR